MDKASRRRAEILEASLKVFAEKGYHGARIEDIASELGMAQGLFYRYFESKRDVFNKVIDEVIEKVTRGTLSDPPSASRTREEYAEQLGRAVDRLFDRFVDDPLASRLLFFEALGMDEEASRKLQALYDLFGEYSASYLRYGVERGFLRQDLRVKETALAFNAVVLEAGRRIARTGDKARARRHWRKAILDLMLEGTTA